jgi:hypothetical protein
MAVHAPPDLPASSTPAGPTLAPEELAGNKLLGLFDRAAARDSLMSTSWVSDLARTSYSHGPPGSTRASTPRSSPI